MLLVTPNGYLSKLNYFNSAINFRSLTLLSPMTRRALALALMLAPSACYQSSAEESSSAAPIRAGIIGLDTSHVLAFTQSLNKGPKKPEDAPLVAGVKVVAAYPQGSKDIESSVSRVPEYVEKVKALGVEIVPSIEELLKRVDVVFLESNDGRVHLEQVRPVLAAKKPVFIDKPIAAHLPDVIRIFEEANKSGTPLWSASSLRFGKMNQAARAGGVGTVTFAETFSPAHTEPTHTELYWYGIHGVEALFTVMGQGCLSVNQTTTPDGKIQVTGTWAGGNRKGIFREANATDRKGYGGQATGDKGTTPVGTYDGYDPLLVECVNFFKTKQVPVPQEETLEIYAFMTAAEESKKRGGAEVTLKEVMDKAKAQASQP